MRAVLGYLNQFEWISNINIGNIMQIEPIKIDEFMSSCKNEYQLGRSSFINKISLLAVGYFCSSTEIRFILQLNEDPTIKNLKVKELESEYWHAKSLEIACTFLPSDWPLVNHILLSYQKHHSPAQQKISEDAPNEDILEIVKPLAGIETNKYQPLIRKVPNGEVMITPLSISPAYKMTREILKSYKNNLINYISGEIQIDSARKDISSSRNNRNTSSNWNREPADEYNNFEEAKHLYSSASYDSKCRGMIENIISNKNTVIEILSNKLSQDEKRILLQKIVDDYDPSTKHNRNFKEGNTPSDLADHSKSMAMGGGSHQSLLLDEEHSKNTNDTSLNYNSFHKRPSSQSCVQNSKAIDRNKIKKSAHNKNHISETSNLQNKNSRIVQEIPESDQLISKKMNEVNNVDSKPSTANKNSRPKSSRDNRSLDPCKANGKPSHSINQKKNSLATWVKTNTNFGK